MVKFTKYKENGREKKVSSLSYCGADFRPTLEEEFQVNFWHLVQEFRPARKIHINENPQNQLWALIRFPA